MLPAQNTELCRPPGADQVPCSVLGEETEAVLPFKSPRCPSSSSVFIVFGGGILLCVHESSAPPPPQTIAQKVRAF